MLCQYGIKSPIQFLNYIAFDCVAGVELSLRSPVKGEIAPGEERYCETNPSIFQCYREESEALYNKFRGNPSPTYLEHLQYLLQLYGPFTKVYLLPLTF